MLGCVGTAISVLSSFRLVAHYDRLRLSTYQARGTDGRRISIRDLGSSTFLRFDAVGYFNIVYSQGDDIFEQFGEIDAFYRGSPFGVRLMSPSLGDAGILAEECRRRGWVPDQHLAWLSGKCGVARQQESRVTIRPAWKEESTSFFSAYLEAFDASPERVPAAVDNMRHLFDEPSLHFLWALHKGSPAGIGILMEAGADALLCAGAMRPGHRGLGGHEALLAYRLALASALGCAEVHSWAAAGGRSHANMERVGLQTVATTRAWRRLPEERR